MITPLPFGEIRLTGTAVMRGVSLVLPTQTVLSILPYGMMLRPCPWTPQGTHPVILFFYDIFRAHMTVPTLLPNLTYFEQIVGVPFVEVCGDFPNLVPGGPFFFMPQLLLTNELAMLGGRMWWGFAKNLARIVVTHNRYEVYSLQNRAIVAIDFEPVTDFAPVTNFPYFETIRPALDQPLVSQVPLGVGPYFVGSRFERNWAAAKMRGISTITYIAQEYVMGLPPMQYPPQGRVPGINESPLGSYEFATSWSQSLIYPTWVV
jgi:hypothetical protein